MIKKVNTFFVYFISITVSIYFFLHLLNSIYGYFYVNDFISIEKKLLIFSMVFSFILSTIFLLFTKDEKLFKNEITYIESPSVIIKFNKAVILKNIEPMKKLIFFIIKKLNFKFDISKYFIIFIIDFNFINLSLFLSFLVFIYSSKILFIDNIKFLIYFFYYNTINVKMSENMFYFFYITGILFSIFFHELMHMVGSVWSTVKKKIFFISSGVGLVLFSPVAYVLSIDEKGKEVIDKRLVFMGPFGNALLSIIFLILGFVFENTIFFLLFVINYLLFMTNIFPLIKFVDGFYLTKKENVEKKYNFFTNNISSFLVVIISLVSLIIINNVPESIKETILFISIILAINFLSNFIPKINVTDGVVKRINLKKDLVNDLFGILRFKYLVEERKESNIIIDYDKKIIRTDHCLVNPNGGYIDIIKNINVYLYLSITVMLLFMLVIFSFFIFDNKIIKIALQTIFFILYLLTLSVSKKDLEIYFIILEEYKKLYLEKCKKIFKY